MIQANIVLGFFDVVVGVQWIAERLETIRLSNAHFTFGMSRQTWFWQRISEKFTTGKQYLNNFVHPCVVLLYIEHTCATSIELTFVFLCLQTVSIVLRWDIRHRWLCVVFLGRTYLVVRWTHSFSHSNLETTWARQWMHVCIFCIQNSLNSSSDSSTK